MRKRRDASKVKDFCIESFDLEGKVTNIALPTKVKYSERQFLKKVEEEDYHLFTPREWIEYFKMKAKEQEVIYHVVDWRKDTSIVKSLINTYGWKKVKIMIDFVWEAPHNFSDKRTMGMWILTKGWLNTILNASELWINGEFNKNSNKKPPREWKGTDDNPEILI